MWTVERVVLAHGFSMGSHERLRQGGWIVRDASTLAFSSLFTPIKRASPGKHWPRSGRGVQARSDGGCTILKLLAWNLTEFDGVLLSDADVCLVEPPGRWMRKQLRADVHHFIASYENSVTRGYNGFSAHMYFLRPEPQLCAILLEMALTASFIPHTNCDQDVLETVFATHGVYPPLPAHVHAKDCDVDDAVRTWALLESTHHNPNVSLRRLPKTSALYRLGVEGIEQAKLRGAAVEARRAHSRRACSDKHPTQCTNASRSWELTPLRLRKGRQHGQEVDAWGRHHIRT